MKYCEITARTFWATRPYDIFPLVLTLEASAVACLCGFHASFFEWESHQRPGERQSHCIPAIANWELWLIVQKESLQNLHLKPYINGSEKAHITVYQQFGLENSCADLFEGSQLLFLRLEWVLICWKTPWARCGELPSNCIYTRKIRTTSEPANNSAGKKLSPGVATGLHRGTSIPNSGPKTGPTMPVWRQLRQIVACMCAIKTCQNNIKQLPLDHE